MKYDQLKTLASALLSRLDDAGNEVRVKGVGKLKLKSDEDAYKEIWESLVKQIFSTMMIHLERPEIELRNVLTQSIIDLSSIYSSAYCAALSESTISKDLKSKLPSTG
jgi:hypothetical protein